MLYFVFTNLLIILNVIGFVIGGGELTERMIADVATFFICTNIVFTFFLIVARECNKTKKY